MPTASAGGRSWALRRRTPQQAPKQPVTDLHAGDVGVEVDLVSDKGARRRETGVISEQPPRFPDPGATGAVTQ